MSRLSFHGVQTHRHAPFKVSGVRSATFAPSVLKLLAWCLIPNECLFKRKSWSVYLMVDQLVHKVQRNILWGAISGSRWQRVTAVTDRYNLIVPAAPQRHCHLSSLCWHSCFQLSSPLAAQKHKYVTRNKACCSMDRRFVFWTPWQHHVIPPLLRYSHALPKSTACQNYTQSTVH